MGHLGKVLELAIRTVLYRSYDERFAENNEQTIVRMIEGTRYNNNRVNASFHFEIINYAATSD